MKKELFAPVLFVAAVVFSVAGHPALAQTPGRPPAVISYYYALPEDEADGVDFDKRDEALRKRGSPSEARNGFLRVGKLAMRVYHRGTNRIWWRSSRKTTAIRCGF